MNQSITWKTLEELQEPFNDAVNYRTRPEKEFFNKIFLRTEELKSCLKPSVYFVIGEKGSGKRCVDRLINCLWQRQIIARPLKHFSHTIVHHDRIIQRITDQRQNRCHNLDVELTTNHRKYT